MSLVDFYFKKMQDARNQYRQNHTDSNRIAFENARKNYFTVIEGRENLV